MDMTSNALPLVFVKVAELHDCFSSCIESHRPAEMSFGLIARIQVVLDQAEKPL